VRPARTTPSAKLTSRRLLAGLAARNHFSSITILPGRNSATNPNPVTTARPQPNESGCRGRHIAEPCPQSRISRNEPYQQQCAQRAALSASSFEVGFVVRRLPHQVLGFEGQESGLRFPPCRGDKVRAAQNDCRRCKGRRPFKKTPARLASSEHTSGECKEHDRYFLPFRHREQPVCEGCEPHASQPGRKQIRWQDGLTDIGGAKARPLWFTFVMWRGRIWLGGARASHSHHPHLAIRVLWEQAMGGSFRWLSDLTNKSRLCNCVGMVGRTSGILCRFLARVVSLRCGDGSVRLDTALLPASSAGKGRTVFQMINRIGMGRALAFRADFFVFRSAAINKTIPTGISLCAEAGNVALAVFSASSVSGCDEA